MSVGPGVAPQASIYGLRVFGCVGSTNLTSAAINWATDPNRDGDPSDHVDVINMSLGSPFGTPDDPSAVSSNNAAALGRHRRDVGRQQRRHVLRQRQPGQRGARDRDRVVDGRRGAGRRDHREHACRDRRHVHRLAVGGLQLGRNADVYRQRLLPGDEPVRLQPVVGRREGEHRRPDRARSTGRSATTRSRAARSRGERTP